jgi:peptidyl-dipeptidase Dcp
MSDNNPLFESSLFPYQAPRFDEINDSHYRPAFDKAMRQKRAEVDAIVAQDAAADFSNTVLALEKSGAMLSRVCSVFFAMASAHTNDDLQALDEAFSTELAALANDIWLNDTLFSRVESVWQERTALDAESRRLVEEIYQRFVLSGARLNSVEKAELKALNTASAALTSQDTRELVCRLTALRARQAQLLGFENYASWSTADQMAKTPAAALAFMRGIVPAARAGRA